VWDVARARLARDARVVRELLLGAVAAAALLAPFVEPYRSLRALGQLGVRSREEIVMFSADAHAAATIAPGTRWLAEPFSGFPKPESEGYAGLTISAFAFLAVLAAMVARFVGALRERPVWHRGLVVTAWLAAMASTVGIVWLLAEGSITVRWGRQLVMFRRAAPWLWAAAAGWAAFAWLTRPREHGSGSPLALTLTGAGVAGLAAAAAYLLALGPRIEVAGRDIGPGPYGWLVAWVPGFDGLRVPARMLTIVTLFLAILAGLGAAWLRRVAGARVGAAAVLAGACLILAESWIAPMPHTLHVEPAAVFARVRPPASGRHTPPIYRVIRELDGPVRLVELPFGDIAYDTLATFYAGFHRRALVNGYSGFFPDSYKARAAVLGGAVPDLAAADRALREAGATHVLLHEAAYLGGRGAQLAAWLESTGWRVVTGDGTDRLFVRTMARP
jgi:hypothetical protein